jgi:hypothetical protein
VKRVVRWLVPGCGVQMAPHDAMFLTDDGGHFDRPLFPLAVVLPRMSAAITSELPKPSPVEQKAALKTRRVDPQVAYPKTSDPST